MPNVYDPIFRSKKSLLENQTCVGRLHVMNYHYYNTLPTYVSKKLYVRISGMTLLTQHKERIINDIHKK